IVGRGLFADAQIDDPHLSRQEFTARAGTRWGRPGAWIEREPARRRHLRPGARLRAGASTFEVRTDAARRSRPRVELALLLPLAASLGFAAMWIFPGAGPWPLIAAGLLTPAGMLLRSRVGRGPLPDPAQLARLGIADPRRREAETEPPWPVDLGNAPARRRLRPAKRHVSPGDVVALIGPGALGLARWVAAQLLSRGGQECPDRAREPAGAGARYELRFASPGASITLIAAPTPGAVPGHATTVVPVRAGHNRAVTRPWYEALARGSTGAELPEVAHVSDHLPVLPHLPWARHDGRLAAPIGVAVGPRGRETATIDLSADAPHAVIAGTTGAGKSELLTSWLCGLAARYPPAHVAMVLVDYKGGATFGALARLPHVLEVLTDLEHPYTVRALRSLRVEILRRERLLKDSGAAHVAGGPSGRSPARPTVWRVPPARDPPSPGAPFGGWGVGFPGGRRWLRVRGPGPGPSTTPARRRCRGCSSSSTSSAYSPMNIPTCSTNSCGSPPRAVRSGSTPCSPRSAPAAR